jgi:hypothetical protein
LSFLQKLRDLPSLRAVQIAVGIWVLFALIIGGVVAARPDKHTVTPEYRDASVKWWVGRESLYNDSQIGYLYLPQAAVLYTPYQLLPQRLGEPFWRLTGLALLSIALWRVAGWMLPKRRAQVFLVASILVIPATCASAQNGQVNLPLAGLMLLTVADIAISRWGVATLWLLLAVMLKPIALAPALLALACFAPLRLRFFGGLALCFASGYLHPNPAYVTAEYHHFLHKFLIAGQPLIKDRFSDFFGMLWHWGFHPSHQIITGVRAAAALITLLLALLISRDFCENRFLRAFGVMFLSVLYLMLFNPRTEENSYVMLAAFTTLLAARDLIGGDLRRGKWLALFTLLLAVDSYGFIYKLTKIWFKPLITLAFFILLVTGKFALLKSEDRGNIGS